MQLKFFGNDLGIFVLGREILKKFPQTSISFYLKINSHETNKGACPLAKIQNNIKEIFSEQSFWETSLKEIFKIYSNADEIVIMYDSRNSECYNFFKKNKNFKKFSYKLLKHFADEGLTDTVEFRRLARKYLRTVKSHNIKALYFPEIIFGEEKTKKILQHLAGPQMRIFTTADFFIEEFLENNPPQSPLNLKEEDKMKRNINIFYNPQNIHLEDLKPLAEKFLKTKISESDFNALE